MKRNLSKIIVVAVALFLVFPITSYATGLIIAPDGHDIIGDAANPLAKVFYQEVANPDGSFTTRYQICNVYFDPAKDNYDYDNPPAELPPADVISQLDIMLDTVLLDVSEYTFGVEDPMDVGLFDFKESGLVMFLFTPGIAEGQYSGVFTVTSIYQLPGSVQAVFHDTGESAEENISFALTMGDGNSGTPAPEPGTLMLLGGALLGLAVLRHQKRK